MRVLREGCEASLRDTRPELASAVSARRGTWSRFGGHGDEAVVRASRVRLELGVQIERHPPIARAREGDPPPSSKLSRWGLEPGSHLASAHHFPLARTRAHAKEGGVEGTPTPSDAIGVSGPGCGGPRRSTLNTPPAHARAREGDPHPLHSALRVGPAAGWGLLPVRFRGDDPQLASYLRIEERKLRRAGRIGRSVTQLQRGLSGELGTDPRSRPR
jgi:hypothetical protein